jgi:hypothetical protein
MFASMFPSKIVINRFFGDCSSDLTNLSVLLLLFSSLLTSSLVNEKKAVSEAEKKAEKHNRRNITRACGRYSSSKNRLSSSKNITRYGKQMALFI